MKKIIVAGAAGFLGSHLTKRLLSAGHRLIGIDNLSTGRLENLNEALQSELFTFIEHDVTRPGIASHPLLAGADEIYHLASPASPHFYQAAPFETIAANTTGTGHMLELARKHGAKFLYTSTSEVYGDPEVHPQHEEYWGRVHTWGPRACYDEAKRLGEVLCYEYWHRYHVAVKVARIFNTYSAGLRNDDGRVISNFVTQALSGDDLTVYGDGTQSRSFCFVDDTVEGLIRLMETDGTAGEIVNIGNPEEHTILELARLVIQLTGSSSSLAFLPLPRDDPKQRRPAIEKARRLLGWTPKVGLREGLRRTIQDYRGKMTEGERRE